MEVQASTYSQVVTLSSPIMLRLRSEGSAANEKITAIFEKLQSTFAFASDLAGLNEWHQVFQKIDFKKGAESLKEKRACTLCKFLFSAIHPKIADKKTPKAEKKLLLSLDDDIRDLIQEILPKNKDSDAFILEYETKLYEKECLQAYNEGLISTQNYYETREKVKTAPKEKIEALLLQTSELNWLGSSEVEEWKVRLDHLNLAANDRETQIGNALNLFLFCCYLVSKAPSPIPQEIILNFQIRIKSLILEMLPKNINIAKLQEHAENMFDEAFFNETKKQKTAEFHEFLQLQMEMAQKNINPHAKIAALLEDLQSSTLFENDESLLNEWDMRLGELTFNSQKEREESAAILLFFLLEHLRPWVLAETPENQIKFSCFENLVKGILKCILPDETDLTDYIQQFEVHFDQEIVLRKIFELIKSSFQRQLKHLTASADRTAADLKNYIFLEKRLQELLDMRACMAEEMSAQIEKLNQKVTRLLMNLNSTGAEIQRSAEQMKLVHDDFLGLIGECEAVLKKV